MVSNALIKEYEAGRLSSEDTLELFAALVRTEQYINLPSSIRRRVIGTINSGYIDLNGNINWALFNNR